MRVVARLTLAAWLTALTAHAASSDNPFGYWLTVDDDGKTAKAVVQIFQRGQEAYGKVVHLVDPPEPNPKCTECTDDRKNQPLLGMEVIRGLKKDGDEWSGGRILDPENGKEYSCYLQVTEHGKKLKVRGYLGLALLGRTQWWRRTHKPE